MSGALAVRCVVRRERAGRDRTFVVHRATMTSSAETSHGIRPNVIQLARGELRGDRECVAHAATGAGFTDKRPYIARSLPAR